MGFLGSIGRTIGSAFTQVKMGNLQGAVSTVLNKQASIIPTAPIFKQVARDFTIPLVSAVGPGLALSLATGPGGFSGGITSFVNSPLSSFKSTGGSFGGNPMALNIGGLLGGLGGIFGGQANQGTAIGTLGQFASLASGFFPSPQMSQVVQTAVAPMQVMGMAPAIRGMATRLTREIFDAGAKVLSRLGIPVSAAPGAFSSTLKRTLSSIASLARRTPSGTMVSLLIGLGLTALEANMLTAWHAQRKKGRRMNAGNPRALRRAARRIKSFHRMCSTIDLLKSRSRRVGTSSRCGSCKKSPCRC
jgi:hypothetical protein